MATRTPHRPEEENYHGEKQPKPIFGSDYDENAPLDNPTDLRDNDAPASDHSNPTDGSPNGNLGGIRRGENNPSSPSTGASDAREQSAIGKSGGQASGHIGSGYKSGDKFMPLQARAVAALAGLFKSKKGRAGAATGGIVGGGMLIFSFISGPAQFIQLSQLMQKFHFSNNDEFIEGRTDKILIYRLAGIGGERGRLGVVSNKASNIWANRVESKTGLRPVYYDRTFRQAGWLIVDRDKAKPYIQQARDAGHDIRRARAEVDGQGLVGPKNDTSIRQGNRQAIVFDRGAGGFQQSRIFNRSISKASGPFGVAQIGARLLIKRGGVSYHILEKYGIRQYLDEKGHKAANKERREQYKQTVKERFAKKVKNGFRAVGGFRVGNSDQDVDGDGKNDPDPNAQQVSQDTQEVLDDYESQKSENPARQNKIRLDIVRSGLGATAVVGVLCATQAVGDQQEEYKYANNILPMMREGSAFVSLGSQVQSGDDTDADELGVYADYFHNEENNTSWNQATTIRQEEGKAPIRSASSTNSGFLGSVASLLSGEKASAQGNSQTTKYDTPPEARLDSATDKSQVFDILDSLGPLNVACDVQDAVFGLPIIKQASDAIGFVTTGAINAALTPFGTSQDELIDAGLAIISGDSVNPYAEGAEFGNIANTGSFLAANDQALTTGGKALSQREVAQLRQYQDNLDEYDKSQESFAQRYLDPSDTSSLVGSLSMPTGLTQFSSSLKTFNPLTSLGNMFGSIFTKQAGAVSAKSIYGVPRYGFSVAERNNTNFEDPYENAKWVETGNRLQKLNDKYGECFNMKVVPSGDSVRIESQDTVNVLKLQKEKSGKYKKCYSNKNELLRYRFYLADVVAAKSAACYYSQEDDPENEACAELGIQSASPTQSVGDETGSGSVSGNAQELARELIDSPKVTGDSRYIDQIKGVANGDGSCHVNKTILKVLVGGLRSGHSFNITSLNRKCTGVLTASGTASYHYADGGGHAVDLGIIDGVTSTGRSSADVAFLKDVFDFMPSGSGVGQVGCPSQSISTPDGIDQFEDSCNHLHIQVPKD